MSRFGRVLILTSALTWITAQSLRAVAAHHALNPGVVSMAGCAGVTSGGSVLQDDPGALLSGSAANLAFVTVLVAVLFCLRRVSLAGAGIAAGSATLVILAPAGGQQQGLDALGLAFGGLLWHVSMVTALAGTILLALAAPSGHFEAGLVSTTDDDTVVASIPRTWPRGQIADRLRTWILAAVFAQPGRGPPFEPGWSNRAPSHLGALSIPRPSNHRQSPLHHGMS